MKINNNTLTSSEYPRIGVNPNICTGKPHIVGTRVTVSTILAFLAGGMDAATLLEHFPTITKDDVEQALGFASQQLQEEFYPFAA